MSVRQMSRVWDHSSAVGNDLLVLLALADFADDQGCCWPSVAALARKSRLDRSTIFRILARLIGSGELERATKAQTPDRHHAGVRGGPQLRNRYVLKVVARRDHLDGPEFSTGSRSVRPPDASKVVAADTKGGRTSDIKVVAVLRHKEPSVDPSLDPSSTSNAPAADGGRPVENSVPEHRSRAPDANLATLAQVQKIAHTVLDGEGFDSIAELQEAVKRACATAGLSKTNELVNRAVATVLVTRGFNAHPRRL